MIFFVLYLNCTATCGSIEIESINNELELLTYSIIICLTFIDVKENCDVVYRFRLYVYDDAAL